MTLSVANKQPAPDYRPTRPRRGHRRTASPLLASPFLALALAGLFPGMPQAQELWLEDIRLSEEGAAAFPPANNGRWIAVDNSGRVHVVWADERDRNYEIYHKYRTGDTWSADQRLTFSAEDSRRPVLAVDSMGRVHLVWNDLRDGNKEIYHRVWDGSWGAETRVSFTPGDSYASSIAADGFNIHLVYQEEINGYLQIMYRYLDLFLWSEAEQLSFVESGMSMVPCIAVGPDGAVHVVWWDTREDSPGVAPGKTCYRKKTGGWSEEEIISGPGADAMRPNIIVDDSGRVHVGWIDKRDGWDQIYYRMHDESGWGEESCLTSGSYTHYHPSLAWGGGKLSMVYWANYPSASNPGLFWIEKNGSFWTGPLRISGEASIAMLGCLISESDGTLHAAWLDKREGNDAIFYNTYIPPATGIGDDPGPPSPGNEDFPLSLGAAPNPAAGRVRFSFSIPAASDVEIEIFDISGRLVRRIGGGRLERGMHPFEWDGRDETGSRAAPGVYFTRAKAGKNSAFTKILLLR